MEYVAIKPARHKLLSLFVHIILDPPIKQEHILHTYTLLLHYYGVSCLWLTHLHSEILEGN